MGVDDQKGETLPTTILGEGPDPIMPLSKLKDQSKAVETYLANAPEDVQSKLRALRRTIKEEAPDAIESISYGMPFYSFQGESGFQARLCYFGFSKKGIVFYTRPAFFEEYRKEAEAYRSTKSALHFPPDKPIPVALVKKLVRNGVEKHRSAKIPA